MKQLLNHQGNMASFSVDYDDKSGVFVFVDGYSNKYFLRKENITGFSYICDQEPTKGLFGNSDYITKSFYIVVYAGAPIKMLYYYIVGDNSEDLKKQELDYANRYNISLRSELKQIGNGLAKQLLSLDLPDEE